MPSKSDKLFQRRKAVTKNSLRRRKPTLYPAIRILIVSEGSITEPGYFKFLKRAQRIPNLDIDICGEECGSSPTSVVNYAEKKANAEGPFSNGGYESVFCVFDRDTHGDFEKANSRIQTLNKPNSKLLARDMQAIRSFPSFEIWLIYHFKYTRAPIKGNGNRSAGANAIRILREIDGFNNYSKNLSEKNLVLLYKNIDVAISNSKKSKQDALDTGELNPSTDVHILVKKIFDSKINEEKNSNINKF